MVRTEEQNLVDQASSARSQGVPPVERDLTRRYCRKEPLPEAVTKILSTGARSGGGGGTGLG